MVVTREPGSELAELADAILTVPVATTLQFGGTLFEQAGLILFDALALELTGSGDDAHADMWRRHTNMQ